MESGLTFNIGEFEMLNVKPAPVSFNNNSHSRVGGNPSLAVFPIINSYFQNNNE